MEHNEFIRTSFDSLQLYFQVWQPETKPRGVICLVHGLGEHSGRYAHWATLLNSANYASIMSDLRGHGKSDGKRGHVSSFEDYLKDVDILLKVSQDRYPDLPCFIYGHSLGGLIVADYVLKRKPRLNGVIITALSNQTSLQEQKFKILLSKVLGTIIPTMTISTGLIPSTISSDSKVVDAYVHDPLVHHQATVGWGKNVLDTISWIEQHANEWTLPVLFMHGELDKLGFPEGSREFANKINSDCTLKIWPGMFHEVHNEPEKEKVFEYLRIWLDAHS